MVVGETAHEFYTGLVRETFKKKEKKKKEETPTLIPTAVRADGRAVP